MTDPTPKAVVVPEGPLWMMHVLGPDDIYAAPDHATAVQWCADLNRQFDGGDVLLVGVPALWIGTPEAHAEQLPLSVGLWGAAAPQASLPPVEGVVTAYWTLHAALTEVRGLCPATDPGPAHDGLGWVSEGNAEDVARDVRDEALWSVAKVVDRALFEGRVLADHEPAALSPVPSGGEGAVAWGWTESGTDTDGDPKQVTGEYGDYVVVLTLSRMDRSWSARINNGHGKLGFRTEDEAKTYAITTTEGLLTSRLRAAQETVALYTHPASDQSDTERMRDDAHERWGILNHLGTVWTDENFETEKQAAAYLDRWKRDNPKMDLSKHRVVPVLVTITAALAEKAADK